MNPQKPSPELPYAAKNQPESPPVVEPPKSKEIGGFAAEGLKEPTRYGDWDVRGRCSDF